MNVTTKARRGHKTTPKLELYVIMNSTMMSTDNRTRSFTKAVNALIADPFL